MKVLSQINAQNKMKIEELEEQSMVDKLKIEKLKVYKNPNLEKIKDEIQGQLDHES